MARPARVFADRDRRFCQILGRLALGNPFLPSRIELEKELLPGEFIDPGRFMSPGADPSKTHENIALITAAVARILPPIRDRYAAGGAVDPGDRAIYLGAAFYCLYDTYDTKLQGLIDAGALAAPFYVEFRKDYHSYVGFLGPADDFPDVKRTFELFFQVRRAFHFLYTHVRGCSMAIARLRAQLWNAIFCGSLDVYVLDLWNRMDRFSTLIQGPTGTGKELCAKAIARSGYVPFNPTTMTFAPHADYYGAINLSALAPGLMESELFGHCEGAFSGAIREKKGLLAKVPRYGAVLLDEIAEIRRRLQVSLLRVLQERTFSPVGDETRELALEARLLTATHRDPAERIACGKLREDFYRRICMLQITTPSLRERLDDTPRELVEVVRFLAGELVGPRRSDSLTDQVVTFIERELPRHPWSGNMREMLQCVADVQVSGIYVPLQMGTDAALERALRKAGMSVDEVSRRYAVSTLSRTGTLAETARVLGVDVRRVKRILVSGEGEA